MTNKPDTATMRADLARLCGYTVIKCNPSIGVLIEYPKGYPADMPERFEPDSEDAPSWQRRAVLEAALHKTPPAMFFKTLGCQLGSKYPYPSQIVCMLATNLQVCEAAWLAAKEAGLI